MMVIRPLFPFAFLFLHHQRTHNNGAKSKDPNVKKAEEVTPRRTNERTFLNLISESETSSR
jgi:hypothetical protein